MRLFMSPWVDVTRRNQPPRFGAFTAPTKVQKARIIMYGNEYQDIGFSLKSISKSMKKLKNKITGGGKKKVQKPDLLSDPVGPGTAQRIPLGFPVVTFSAGSPTTFTSIVNPQKPFMPRRLIINDIKTGVSAVGQTLLSAFVIATEDMLAGAGPIPVEAFASNATDMVLMTRAARPGINIALRFDWIAAVPLAGVDTVTVSAVLIGDAVSQ
jgi:hypothetical protein